MGCSTTHCSDIAAGYLEASPICPRTSITASFHKIIRTGRYFIGWGLRLLNMSAVQGCVFPLVTQGPIGRRGRGLSVPAAVGTATARALSWAFAMTFRLMKDLFV